MLMPFTSIAGTDEITSFKNKPIENDDIDIMGANELMISFQQISLVNPIIAIEELIIQIQNLIDFVLQNYGNDPEIVALCQEITNIINSFLNGKEEICYFLMNVTMIILLLLHSFESGTIMAVISVPLSLFIFFIYLVLCGPPTLNSIENTIESDEITTIINIIGESSTVNTCTCGE